MQLIKIVFDSNLYISAALNPEKYTASWLDEAASGDQFVLFTSAAILREVQQKLASEKFQAEPADIKAFLEFVESAATVVNPKEEINIIESDPDDNKILECAVEAEAHLVVTADSDLLELKKFRGIGFAHPRDLKYIFQKQGDGSAASH